MTKMVYMTASTNLYSITAPFSTSTPTLVSSDSFLIIEILLCRETGLHLSFQEWLVVFRQYTYLNIRVRRSLLRTVSVAEGLISYEDIKNKLRCVSYY
jgi:hypothetical protein